MEEAHDAQPRLVMTELRRAAFSEESHVRASWLPTSDFILRYDGSWRTPHTDESVSLSKRIIEVKKIIQ